MDTTRDTSKQPSAITVIPTVRPAEIEHVTTLIGDAIDNRSTLGSVGFRNFTLGPVTFRVHAGDEWLTIHTDAAWRKQTGWEIFLENGAWTLGTQDEDGFGVTNVGTRTSRHAAIRAALTLIANAATLPRVSVPTVRPYECGAPSVRLDRQVTGGRCECHDLAWADNDLDYDRNTDTITCPTALIATVHGRQYWPVRGRTIIEFRNGFPNAVIYTATREARDALVTAKRRDARDYRATSFHYSVR